MFSHVTAAELWRLPLPLGWGFRSSEPLHVTRLEGRAIRRPGIVGHVASDVGRERIGPIPVVTPLQAWAECAALLRLDDLVAMGDALLAEWSPFPRARLLTLDELAADVAARFRFRGVLRLRAALALVRPNVRSPQETDMRLLFDRAGLPEAELNAEVRDDDNRWLGISDFVYREPRFVVEYEGDHHRTNPKQFMSDIARGERYADAGWRMVRATRDDLYRRPGELVARVWRLHGRGA